MRNLNKFMSVSNVPLYVIYSLSKAVNFNLLQVLYLNRSGFLSLMFLGINNTGYFWSRSVIRIPVGQVDQTGTA